MEQLKSTAAIATPASQTTLPDLYAIRDEVLSHWRVGKRAESRERLYEFASRLIDAIIENPGFETPCF